MGTRKQHNMWRQTLSSNKGSPVCAWNNPLNISYRNLQIHQDRTIKANKENDETYWLIWLPADQPTQDTQVGSLLEWWETEKLLGALLFWLSVWSSFVASRIPHSLCKNGLLTPEAILKGRRRLTCHGQELSIPGHLSFQWLKKATGHQKWRGETKSESRAWDLWWPMHMSDAIQSM